MEKPNRAERRKSKFGGGRATERGGWPTVQPNPVLGAVAPTDSEGPELPKTDAPKAATPKTDAPKAATPKAATPKAATPTADAPKADVPTADAPKANLPKADSAIVGDDGTHDDGTHTGDDALSAGSDA